MIDWLSKDKNLVKHYDNFETQNVYGQTIFYSFENKSLKEDLKDIGVIALRKDYKAEKDNQSLVIGT